MVNIDRCCKSLIFQKKWQNKIAKRVIGLKVVLITFMMKYCFCCICALSVWQLQSFKQPWVLILSCYDVFSYDFTNDPKSVRQYNLKQNYYFDCHCLACENNWETRKKWNPSDDEYGFLLSPLRNHIIEVQRGNLSSAKRFRTEVIDLMKEIENEMEENKPLYVFHNLQFILMACNRCFGNIRRSLA